MINYRVKFLGLALAGLILGACSQTGTYETADLMNEQAAAAKAGFTMTPFGMGNENAMLANCANCVTEAQVQTEVVSKTTGGVNNSTTTDHGSFTIFNTPTDIVVTFSFNGNDGADEITQTINGINYSWSKEGAKNPAFTNVTVANNGKIISYKITQALGVKTKCTPYSVSFSSNGGPGGSLSKTAIYNIYEYCSNCDAESFSYVTSNNNLDVLFSYNYKEVATMTLTFTLSQAKIELATGSTYVGADGKSYLVGGNGTNLTWTGAVSCSKSNPTTFDFDFVADCGPSTAGDGKANIWTNTVVKAINGVTLVDDPTTTEVDEGPYSLKGSLSTIVHSGCPITK